MPNQDGCDAAEAEIERVRRHVIAVRERIRALDALTPDSDERNDLPL